MLRTIMIGTSILIQGVFVRRLDNGKIVVRVDDRKFVGEAVNP